MTVPERAVEAALGRFGHHPDPAIDFCVEVEVIEGLIYDAAVGLAKPEDVRHRVETAMMFRVGGDLHAVEAKQLLRAKAAALPLVGVQGGADLEAVGDARARKLVEEQANDEGLWFQAQTCAEAYVQNALRKLHAAVEGDDSVIFPAVATALPKSQSGERDDVARALELARDALTWVTDQEIVDPAATCLHALNAIDRVLAIPHTGQPQEGRAREARLADALSQALRQWRMYAEELRNDDFETEQSVEADIWRDARSLLSAAPASPHEVHERDTPVVKPIGQEKPR